MRNDTNLNNNKSTTSNYKTTGRSGRNVSRYNDARKTSNVQRKRNKNKNEKEKEKEKIKEDKFEELENISSNGKNYSVYDNVIINGKYCAIRKIKKYLNNDTIWIEFKEYEESETYLNRLYLKWIEKKDDVKLHSLGEKIKVFSVKTFNKLYPNDDDIIPDNVWYCQYTINPNFNRGDDNYWNLLKEIDGYEKIYDTSINTIDVESCQSGCSSDSSSNDSDSDSSNDNCNKDEFGFDDNHDDNDNEIDKNRVCEFMHIYMFVLFVILYSNF